MLVTCSNCKGRFRIADERVPAAGVRARCSRCSTILFVRHGYEAVAETALKMPPAPAPAPAPLPVPGGLPDPWGGASEEEEADRRQPSAGPAAGGDPLPPLPPQQDIAAGHSPGPRALQEDPFGPGVGVHSPGPRALQEDPFGPGVGVHSPGPPALQDDPFRVAFADLPSGPPPPPPSAEFDEEVGSLAFDPFNPPLPGFDEQGPGAGDDAAGVAGAEFDPFAEVGEALSAAVGVFPSEDGSLAEEGVGALDSPPAAGIGPPPAPAPVAGREEGQAPFPQRSTVRRAPSRESQHQRMRPLAKVAGESRFSVFFWGLVVAGMVAFGALVGLGRDPLGIWALVGFGDVGEAIQLHSKELSAGLYPAADGEQLLYVRGIVYRHQREPSGDVIRVKAKLFDAGGAPVGESAGWAGVIPQPEELAAVRDEASWTELSRRLADRLPPKELAELPFVLAFPEVDPGTRRLRIEVVATAVPTSAPVVAPAPAVGSNE